MKITNFLATLMLASSILFASCGGAKDSDIEKAVEEKLKGKPDMTSADASVKDGVATLSGECKDATCKADCEQMAKSVKGVKSVVNNMTIAQAAMPPNPVDVATESALSQGVKDATKDHPGVNATVSADGVITLTGDIKRDKLSTLMQSLNTLKPKKIENNLTIK
jgi:hyperosmotically inducible periplasmic protein